MKSNVAQAMAKISILTTNKANSIFVNTFAWLWWVIHASQFLSHSFPKSLKLTEKAMVHILDLIDNEWCFSLVFFLEEQIVQPLESSFLTSCCYVCTKVLHAWELSIPSYLWHVIRCKQFIWLGPACVNFVRWSCLLFWW